MAVFEIKNNKTKFFSDFSTACGERFRSLRLAIYFPRFIPACGERSPFSQMLKVRVGSSPRVRGTPHRRSLFKKATSQKPSKAAGAVEVGAAGMV
jgi:hypothetical protein